MLDACIGGQFLGAEAAALAARLQSYSNRPTGASIFGLGTISMLSSVISAPGRQKGNAMTIALYL